jgi:hypothetical protein
MISLERLQYSGPRALFAGTNSFFFEERDPFLHPFATERATLFDRYVRFRAGAANPLLYDEIEDAARFSATRGSYGPPVAKAVRARAE